MQLGAFSVRLAVKDIKASTAFYEKLDFTDVRELQRTLKERGVSLQEETDEETSGPAHFTLLDPDGNTILFDQHV